MQTVTKFYPNWLKTIGGADSSASESRVRGPGLDTRSSHIIYFLIPLIQDGQMLVRSTDEVCILRPAGRGGPTS